MCKKCTELGSECVQCHLNKLWRKMQKRELRFQLTREFVPERAKAIRAKLKALEASS